MAEQLNQTSKEIEDYLITNNALSKEYPEQDDSGLEGLLKQHEKNYENLKASLGERINKCKVIGMTLDSYIGRFSNVQIRFSDIFVDEAGYVPLIKALTLFSSECNITFLGDHKQLPPVCEFDNYNDIPGLCRLLWSKSSLFSEMILHHDEEYCLNIAEGTDCPEFTYTIESTLTESHRFGANLCELLDRLIYNIGYRSALVDDLELFYVEAENPIRDDRRNITECEKIYNIILGSEIDKNYCILTPYLKQVALLQEKIQKARQEERILTIHKSQGREWDTVILSVVDGRNITPWFTDSINPISQGLYVLNTAISRAKKKLIIISDANYWLARQDAESQFISNLIRISKRTPD
jgi:superfamily I DNA and/or RNA helicase